MKIDTGNTNTEPRIELVPLIDIIFCILTFFLLAGLQIARQQAISVDIPKASTGAPAARELLMVTLNDAGQLFLEQQPMLVPGQLVESVKQYRQARPNSSIVLYASKQVSYSKVVEVLDALRGVAGDRVALATLPSNTTAPTPPIITPDSPYQNNLNPATTPNSGTVNPIATPPNSTANPASGAVNQPTPTATTPIAQPTPTATPYVVPTTPIATPTVVPGRSTKP
jgi:biopolymer transport protein ExbD